MHKITIEDCIKKIPNRFELSLVATYRARQISKGHSPKIEMNCDNPAILALHEIAYGKVGIELLTKTII